MDAGQEETMVLGAIRNGAKKFDKMRQMTKMEPEKLNKTLERLEERGLIRVEEKKGFLGKKIEIQTTPKGDEEIESKIVEMEQKWGHMVSLYKSGDKGGLGDAMQSNRSMLPMLMLFGIVDMMMFSMMFSMMGASMTDYVPAEQVPDGYDDGGDAGGDAGDGGDFDFDIGF